MNVGPAESPAEKAIFNTQPVLGSLRAGGRERVEASHRLSAKGEAGQVF